MVIYSILIFQVSELMDIVSRIGASFTEELSSDNTHFICTVPKGPKYERALELNIPVVNPEFLKACETQRKVMPSHLFYMKS
jgi:NAD-dependent DNA ligase